MILFRYLAKEILLTMLAVSLTLLVISMSSRLVSYLGLAASGDLAPNVVASVMMLRIPAFLELVLPLGLFIGILLAYGRLYVESEMTVMSACGLSTGQLTLYTLIPALLVAVLVGWLSLYATPVAASREQAIWQDARNANTLDLLVAGRFRVDDKTGRVSYIEKLSADHKTMKEVFSADQSGPNQEQQLSVVYAQQGKIEVNPDDNSRYLVLNNGYQYIGQPGGKSYRVTSFDQFGQLIEEPKQGKHYKKTDSRSTRQLLRSKRLEDKATLQWRISLAVMVPIAAMIALALSKTNHRRGRYVKMLPAFMVHLSYLVALNAVRDAIEKQKIPVDVGMWWVHGVYLLLALVLLFGGDLRRRVFSPARVANNA